MEIHHKRGYVYSLLYHLVWCVKYNRKVLDEQVDAELIRIASDHGFGILETSTDLDHVHLLTPALPA